MLLIAVVSGFAGWLLAMLGGRLLLQGKNDAGAAGVILGFVFIMLGVLVGR
jgi:hypothetical protein